MKKRGSDDPRESHRRNDRRPDDWELTPAQMRELDRRLSDFDNPVRYLLVSLIGPKFFLYYNVSDDVYIMNDPWAATLFKQRVAAKAVQETLGSSSIRIVRCRTRKRKGKRLLVRASLPKYLT